ncbi:hypothetical protein [Streptomyces erythrochromogenes]|uniref:hypothetical protein n=1 Tax=Streptomyces erythrochromogenes TaxID=285574 RepID=UPI0002E15EC8
MTYVQCTRLMRASRFGLWARLRRLLAERGLTISTAVLVHLFPDTTSHWQAHPLRSEIADACVWRPPAGRAYLDRAEEATGVG